MMWIVDRFQALPRCKCCRNSRCRITMVDITTTGSATTSHSRCMDTTVTMGPGVGRITSEVTTPVRRERGQPRGLGSPQLDRLLDQFDFLHPVGVKCFPLLFELGEHDFKFWFCLDPVLYREAHD